MCRRATRKPSLSPLRVEMDRPEKVAEAGAGMDRLEARGRGRVRRLGRRGRRGVERGGLVGVGEDRLRAPDPRALDGQDRLGKGKAARALDERDFALDPVAEPGGREIVDRQADGRRLPGLEPSGAHEGGELHVGEGGDRPAMGDLAEVEVPLLDAEAVPDALALAAGVDRAEIGGEAAGDFEAGEAGRRSVLAQGLSSSGRGAKAP